MYVLLSSLFFECLYHSHSDSVSTAITQRGEESLHVPAGIYGLFGEVNLQFPLAFLMNRYFIWHDELL